MFKEGCYSMKDNQVFDPLRCNFLLWIQQRNVVKFHFAACEQGKMVGRGELEMRIKVCRSDVH